MYVEILEWYLDFGSVFKSMFQMCLSLVCGGIIGFERGRKKRPAGFRTYILVCLGATLVMMTNEYICGIYKTGDVSRMGAQVVNGIGFLGAGTIITTGHNRVKGLTTAAGLWASACIGLAIGSGFYEGAILGTALIVVVMVVFHHFDKKMSSSLKLVILHMEFKKMATIRRLTAFAREQKIELEDIEIENVDNTKAIKSAVITMHLPIKTEHSTLIEQIREIEGIVYVEEI